MQDRLKDIARELSERLKARRKLVKVAQQIVQQIPEPVQPVGIDDVSYWDCSLQGVDYVCSGGSFYSIPDPLYCTGTKAFICREFACDETGGVFLCQSTYDHVCTDLFACSSGGKDNAHSCFGYHGFFCDDDFHCYGDFTCKGGGKDCNEAHPYNLEGGKDPTPGDFTCGWPGGNADDFDCNTKFSCLSDDDFRCVNSTDFDCGTSDPIDRFDCGGPTALTQFQCDGTDFTCNPMSQFGCASEFQCKKPNPFSCASYSCQAPVTYRDEDF